MSDELAERGLPLELVRAYDKELGTWTGGGPAETFRERYQAALDDLEATLDELVRESAE